MLKMQLKLSKVFTTPVCALYTSPINSLSLKNLPGLFCNPFHTNMVFNRSFTETKKLQCYNFNSSKWVTRDIQDLYKDVFKATFLLSHTFSIAGLKFFFFFSTFYILSHNGVIHYFSTQLKLRKGKQDYRHAAMFVQVFYLH